MLCYPNDEGSAVDGELGKISGEFSIRAPRLGDVAL